MANMFTFMTYLADTNCAKRFLGFVPWNYYLQMDPNNACQITNFHLLGGNSSLLLIGLAILDDLFQLAGVLAVAFIVYSGFQFVLSQGAPDEAAKARTTAINALVGLGISLVAITFVSYLGTRAGGGQGTTVGPYGLNLGWLPNPGGAESGSVLQTALSVAFEVLGAIAFLIIVIAGMQYAFSQGDAQTTARAKAAIIYAFVGLVIALVAQSIVSFALSRS